MIFSQTRRIRATFLRVIAFGGSLLGVGATAACARTGHVEVRDQNEKPCFLLNMEGERRAPPDLVTLFVDDVTFRPTEAEWSFVLPERTPLSLPPQSCIRYGEVPVGATVREPAKSLQPGRVYEVFCGIRVFDSWQLFGIGIPDSRKSSESYTSKFCLLPGSDGKLRVHQLVFTGDWHEEECQLKH